MQLQVWYTGEAGAYAQLLADARIHVCLGVREALKTDKSGKTTRAGQRATALLRCIAHDLRVPNVPPIFNRKARNPKHPELTSVLGNAEHGDGPSEALRGHCVRRVTPLIQDPVRL